jgi:hypothetical protein
MRPSFLPSAALLALALMLGGCNLVYSEHPLFTWQDATGAPALRPGVWLELDAKCRFDETAPTTRWPKCAEWVLVGPDQVRGPEGDPPVWRAFDYVLAAGEPRVLQVALPNEATPAPLPYVYLGLEALRLDAEGRIVQYQAWNVQCGPPPPDAPGAPHPSLTKSPLPGLKPAPDAEHQDNCLADSVQAVRWAARASAGWGDPRTWRWVRDGER